MKKVLKPIAIVAIVALLPVLLVLAAGYVCLHKYVFRQRTYDGVTYKLVDSTLREWRLSGKLLSDDSMAKFLRVGGGAVVTYVSKEALAATKVTSASMPFLTRQLLKLTTPGYAICLIKEQMKTLTKQERKAIILHEIGHIKCKHLENPIPGINYELRNEMEADAYAAERVGAEVLISALEKCYVYAEKYVIEELGVAPSGRVDLDARIAKLKNLAY